MDEASAQAGKSTNYEDQYNPNVLVAENRDAERNKIGIDVQDLPFKGVDIWNYYDFTWLNPKGVPEYGMLTIYIPCDSPNVIEAKSLKLYLLSFANSQFQSVNEIIATMQQDLANVIGAPVRVMLANILLNFMHVDAYMDGTNIDNLEVKCADTEVNAELLHADSTQQISEVLNSNLLKTIYPVLGKPDWASVRVTYTGPKIDQTGLLQYLVSYRNYQVLPEQCIERIFCDILNKCKPSNLVVEGRFMRRGGCDVNPIRANGEFEQLNRRLFRQ